jgi:hypothetical protein
VVLLRIVTAFKHFNKDKYWESDNEFYKLYLKLEIFMSVHYVLAVTNKNMLRILESQILIYFSSLTMPNEQTSEWPVALPQRVSV